MPIYEEKDAFSKPGEREIMEWVHGGMYFLIVLLIAILVVIILALLGPAIGNVFSSGQVMGSI